REQVSLSAEPAVLALAREMFGPGDVLLGPTDAESPPHAKNLYSFGGLDFTVPVRIRVRGDVVAADHVLSARDPAWAKVLDLSPLAAPPRVAPPEAAMPPAGPVASVLGRITDASGRPLAGVTVGGGGLRATTGR